MKTEDNTNITKSNNKNGDSNEEGKEKVFVFGIKDCVLLLVGNVVGAGIFMSPTDVAIRLNNNLLTHLFWGLGGILALIGSFCYVELGTLLPEAGGEGGYVSEALHPYLGAIYFYLSVFITMPGANYYILNTGTKALLNGFFAYDIIKSDNYKISWILLPILNLMILTILGLISIFIPKMVFLLSQASMASKVISILVIIISGLITVIRKNGENFPTIQFQKEDESWFYHFILIISALLNAMWSYDGWNSVNLLGSNVKSPNRTIPISLISSLLIIIVLYQLINLAYLKGVPNTIYLNKSDTVASVLAEIASGSKVWGQIIYPVFIFLAILGSANGGLLCGVFVSQTASQQGFLPKVLAVEFKRGIPIYSLCLQIILTIALGLFGKAVPVFFSVVNLGFWVFYALAAVSLIVLRWTKPDAKRSFKAPIILPIIFIAAGTLFLVGGIISYIAYGVVGTKSPFSDNYVGTAVKSGVKG
eukprot:GHVP01014702.1.p1 GENE.GHVP01014702.1~~GHVP01014702.1.p1  ORF type:complete len:476 (+),score=60.94 GHVP01014702.1:31-1458(+)